MTREEATERLKMILEEATTDENAICYVTSDDADALEMAIKVLEIEPNWIPVTERLPEKAGDYLVVFRYMWIYRREVCYFDGNTWDKGEYDEVVKWQYLPNIEEGEDKE